MIADKDYDSDEYRAALRAKAALHPAPERPQGTCHILQNRLYTTP